MKKLKYDFALALGDTINEKYEALYVLIHNHNEINPIRFVVGHPDTIALFETATAGFDASPIVCNMGELKFVGQLGGVNRTMCFQVFKSERAVKDELVLFGENGNAVVKFKNWIT